MAGRDRRIMKRGLAPVVATTIVVILVIFAAVITYFAVTSFQTKIMPKEEPTELKQRAKIEAFSVINSKERYVFKLYVRNIGEANFTIDSAYLKSPGGVVYKAIFIQSQEIAPGEVAAITVGFNLEGQNVYGTYVLELGGGGACVCTIAVHSSVLKSSPKLTVYLIDLTSQNVPGHWVDPQQVRRYLENYAYVEVIDTWEKLDNLIRNPPERAVIINTHGELVPMPRSWISDPNDSEAWQEAWKQYFMKIGLNIRDKGWIWVSIKGYPFYYCPPEGGDIENYASKYCCGPAGINRVLSVIGARADFWSANDGVTTTQLTDLGRMVAQMLELSLASEADTPRACRSMTGIAPALIFYSTTANDKTYYGSAAYRLGNGFIVINGFSSGYDPDQTARVAVLTAVYTYMYSARPPRKVFTTPPHVYVLALENTHSHWVDKDEVAQASSWLASLYTPHVSLVTSYNDLEQLFANPPENCIVFNAHGEAVPIPDSYVGDSGRNWRIWSCDNAVEIFIASLGTSYTLYKEINPSEYPEGIKIVYEHLILSDVHLAVGVFTGSNPPDAGSGSQRVFQLETRDSADSEPLPDFVFVWGTSSGFSTAVLDGEAEYLTWYKVELEIVPEPGSGRAKGHVKIYRGDQLIAESDWKTSDVNYNDIKYVGVGVWGVSSRDGAYLIKYIELYKKSGTEWTQVWRVDASSWEGFWSGAVDNANDEYRPRWAAYFARITWYIKTRGWIYVSPVGYPFYYVVNVHYDGAPGWSTGDSTHEWHIGSAGINFVIRLMGGTAESFFNSAECELTEAGSRAASLFPEAHITRVLSADDVSRAQRIRDIPSERLIIFYDDTGGDPILTGTVAVKFNSGYLLLNGYAAHRLTEASKAATAFALYLYKITFDS